MTPSDTTTHWVDLLHDFGPWIGAGSLAIVGWFRTKGKQENEDSRLRDDIKSMKTTVAEHTVLLSDHSSFIRGQAQMAADLRSTRDCVISIASHLKIDGPR